MPDVHVVFTLPHTLLPRCHRNAALVYTLLVQASAVTLLEVARNPQYLGAEIGGLSILHTWGQTLVRHPHVHCVVPSGGLSPDHQRWIRPKYPGVFLPVTVLSRVCRGTFVAALRYLGRDTHRVAISNHRWIAFDGERVTFRWKDYAHGHGWRTMTLTAMALLRRFVQHVLPRGFVRIRHFGSLATPCRTTRLALARTLLGQPPAPARSRDTAATSTATGRCPQCGGPMTVGPIFTARQFAAVCLRFDTS